MIKIPSVLTLVVSPSRTCASMNTMHTFPANPQSCLVMSSHVLVIVCLTWFAINSPCEKKVLKNCLEKELSTKRVAFIVSFYFLKWHLTFWAFLQNNVHNNHTFRPLPIIFPSTLLLSIPKNLYLSTTVPVAPCLPSLVNLDWKLFIPSRMFWVYLSSIQSQRHISKFLLLVFYFYLLSSVIAIPQISHSVLWCEHVQNSTVYLELPWLHKF